MPRKKRGGDARKGPPVLLAAVLGAAAAIAAVRVRRGAARAARADGWRDLRQVRGAFSIVLPGPKLHL